MAFTVGTWDIFGFPGTWGIIGRLIVGLFTVVGFVLSVIFCIHTTMRD